MLDSIGDSIFVEIEYLNIENCDKWVVVMKQILPNEEGKLLGLLLFAVKTLT